MPKLVNPSAVIKVLGSQELTIPGGLYVNFEINKDLYDEPNEANITISNLNPAYNAQLRALANESAPVELYATAAGRASHPAIMGFRGELETATHYNTNPGVETELYLTGQRINHRSFYLDNVVFAAGTPISTVMQSFINAIGLPAGNVYDLPNNGILLSESFSGPAFPLLQRYAFDLAYYTYIVDGKLYITDAYEPPESTVFQINEKHLLSNPEPTSRENRSLIEMKAIVEGNTASPFPPKNKRRRKKNKPKKVIGANDYVEYQAVDTDVLGMDFHIMMNPQIQPDSVVSFDGKFYRVIGLTHVGETEYFDTWDTMLRTDVYEPTGGDWLSV